MPKFKFVVNRWLDVCESSDEIEVEAETLEEARNFAEQRADTDENLRWNLTDSLISDTGYMTDLVE